jgi:hypothetical protein
MAFFNRAKRYSNVLSFATFDFVLSGVFSWLEGYWKVFYATANSAVFNFVIGEGLWVYCAFLNDP